MNALTVGLFCIVLALALVGCEQVERTPSDPALRSDFDRANAWSAKTFDLTPLDWDRMIVRYAVPGEGGHRECTYGSLTYDEIVIESDYDTDYLAWPPMRWEVFGCQANLPDDATTCNGRVISDYIPGWRK